MALKFGSKSGSGYTRSAFPMQSGTASHTSALKVVDDEAQESLAEEVKRLKLEDEKAKIISDREKQDNLKKEEGKSAGEKLTEDKYDLEYKGQSFRSQRDLDIFKANEAETAKEAKTSEKTKRLRGETKLQDQKTELHKQRSEKAEDISALGRKGRREARKKGESDELGRGLFGGYLKRKKAGKKYKKSQKKEDRIREQLAESEAWDQLSPDEKTAKQREKMAYLTAMFDSDAQTMHQISKGQFNVAKGEEEKTKGGTGSDLEKGPDYGGSWLQDIGGVNLESFYPDQSTKKVTSAYEEEPGAGGEEEPEGQV